MTGNGKNDIFYHANDAGLRTCDTAARGMRLDSEREADKYMLEPENKLGSIPSLYSTSSPSDSPVLQSDVHAEFVYCDHKQHHDVRLCGEWIDWKPLKMKFERGRCIFFFLVLIASNRSLCGVTNLFTLCYNLRSDWIN